MSKAIAEVIVDTSEAEKKLAELKQAIEDIYALIDKSWIMRLLFYGWRSIYRMKKG